MILQPRHCRPCPAIVETLYGKVETPTVRGFDLAMVPVAKARFLGAAPPRVLVKVLELVDGAAITEACNTASRARVHAGKSPVVVLLFSRRIAPQTRSRRRTTPPPGSARRPTRPTKSPSSSSTSADWSCRLPPNCSPAVRKLADSDLLRLNRLNP